MPDYQNPKARDLSEQAQQLQQRADEARTQKERDEFHAMAIDLIRQANGLEQRTPKAEKS